MSVVGLLVGVVVALVGLGFGLGWWVRGAYVRGYLRRRLRGGEGGPRAPDGGLHAGAREGVLQPERAPGARGGLRVGAGRDVLRGPAAGAAVREGAMSEVGAALYGTVLAMCFGALWVFALWQCWDNWMRYWRIREHLRQWVAYRAQIEAEARDRKAEIRGAYDALRAYDDRVMQRADLPWWCKLFALREAQRRYEERLKAVVHRPWPAGPRAPAEDE